MRNFLAVLLVIISVIVIVIPTLLVRGCTFNDSEFKNPRSSVIKVFNSQSNTVQNMNLEEYLKGVVAAEMPATFEIEALKAQAILARTYVLHRLIKGQRVPEHPEAVISTDFQSGQAWISQEELKKKWGLINYLFYWNKISRAVEITSAQVLVYNGQLIEALYHSNSGGLTEDAANVWGNSVPYLKNVVSEFDHLASNYQREFNFTWAELDKKLGTDLVAMINKNSSGSDMKLNRTDNGLIEILEFSTGERILQIRIDGQIFTGIEIRRLLNLPSTKFKIETTLGGLKFIVFGNGHGVGMSQYGANGMAKNGVSYSEILKHYFPGTNLGKISK